VHRQPIGFSSESRPPPPSSPSARPDLGRSGRIPSQHFPRIEKARPRCQLKPPITDFIEKVWVRSARLKRAPAGDEPHPPGMRGFKIPIIPGRAYLPRPRLMRPTSACDVVLFCRPLDGYDHCRWFDQPISGNIEPRSSCPPAQGEARKTQAVALQNESQTSGGLGGRCHRVSDRFNTTSTPTIFPIASDIERMGIGIV
jgi:hypothetical protein